MVRWIQGSLSKIATRAVLLPLALLPAGGCSSSNPSIPALATTAIPGNYVVRPGDTIYYIALRHGVSPASLLAVNSISDPRQLRVGQTLVIPARPTAADLSSFSGSFASQPQREFAWPVVGGVVSSPFGIRKGVMHDGIDIVAETGTAVRAAADGMVVFSGRLRGYGNAVILQHSEGYVTVYGHNQRNLVRYGEEVVRGQIIAELGSTGRATGPNLHFELRLRGQPQNPLVYLPQPSPGNGISFARNSGL